MRARYGPKFLRPDDAGEALKVRRARMDSALLLPVLTCCLT
jgi:hypothetical protein